MKKNTHKLKFLSIQSKAAKIIGRAYRTVCTKALLVLATTPSIDLVARDHANALREESRKESVKNQILRDGKNSAKTKTKAPRLTQTTISENLA